MIIRVEHATKRFGRLVAADSLSFTVKKGEVVGFVGANGAGKSTTINMLLGFTSPSEGSIALFDKPVRPQTAHHSHEQVGYGAGDMELPRGLTARQYLRLVARQAGSAFSDRLKDLERRFVPELDKKIGTLSRGNKQKIALIAAFLPQPKLVVLDEPTSGLDPIMQEAFLQLVRDEQAAGTTIFMSSHYLNEVADVCSRVILMRHGKIIEDISSKELLGNSGKTVRVVTGYRATKPPRGAEQVSQTTGEAGQTVIEFSWKAEPAKLQQWLAGVKQLIDIEVTEYNLEGAFKEMYDSEEVGEMAK